MLRSALVVPALFHLAVLAQGALAASAGDGCAPLTPSVFDKPTIDFPNDPFRASGPGTGGPGWVKFVVLACDPELVHFQDSNQFPFHYDFATQVLGPFAGMTPEEFDGVTLFQDGQEAVLGAVVMPPLAFSGPQIEEYGVQLVGQDPIAIEDVIDLFHAVASSVQAGPGVQAFYFPTFEQLPTAEANAGLLAAEGIELGSAAQWSTTNECYSRGWALGPLKFVPAGEIDAAFQAGELTPDDILLTDGIPAEIPVLAGVVTLAPATPNSHVAILANTFQIPFVFLSESELAAKALALVDKPVILRAFEDLSGFAGSCTVSLLEVDEGLSPRLIDEILALKVPAPLDLSPIAPTGTLDRNVATLGPDDIGQFGGKASNFGILRRAIPENSPAGLGISFDLWWRFGNQVMPSGQSLRDDIAAILGQYSYPPADMAAFAADLDTIRDWFKDPLVTSFEAADEAGLLAGLQDPEYGLDPNSKIRFRSSTNVEDSGQFTGAGLYDSFSGCLQDDLDPVVLDSSYCDPTKDEERGVLRAIRKVFASFYNENAVLERLRYGVDEAEVGMALLVHHSFPDEIELANGVAILDRGFTTKIELVTQPGAVSVANPDSGAIPEEVDVFVSSTSTSPVHVTGASLLPLGDTVLEWQTEYVDLAQLLVAAADQFAAETGKQSFVLDFEYKKLAPGGAALPAGGLIVKQIREVPQPSTDPTITPILVNEPQLYQVLQGGGQSVFANHRLKANWLLRTKNMWLDPAVLSASSVYDHVGLASLGECVPDVQLGPMEGMPGHAHAFDEVGTSTDSWQPQGFVNGRTVELDTDGLGTLVSPAESPIVTLGELGFDGSLSVRVEYDDPVWGLDTTPFGGGNVVLGTSDAVTLMLPVDEFELPEAEVRTFRGAGGVEVTTTFYWAAPFAFCAGCIFPLTRWEGTTITGLTSEPLVLTSPYAQSYEAGQHNFTEWFLFEPRLDPATTQAQLDELAAQDVDLVFVYSALAGAPSVQLLAADPCPPSPWQNLESGLAGKYGIPTLAGAGSLLPGDTFSLKLVAARESSVAYLGVGTSALLVPFFGGTLVPNTAPPGFAIPLSTSPQGTLELGGPWPGVFPPGTELYLQYWILDSAAPQALAASNAMRATVP